VYDAGDVVCEGDALEEAQVELGRQVAGLLGGGHLPIMLGGGHEIAWGSWQGLAAHASLRSPVPRIGVLNLDAHFDLRAAVRATSGTPFRQIAEDCQTRGWPFRYAVLGVNEAANTTALFERARALDVVWRLDERCQVADRPEIAERLNGFIGDIDWLYLTICLDVLAEAVAPGVSAPASHGVPLEVIAFVVAAAAESG
jgi:formiminoglutamase